MFTITWTLKGSTALHTQEHAIKDDAMAQVADLNNQATVSSLQLTLPNGETLWW